MTFEAPTRSLSDFTVELDVYSGPYEWLLALILKDELEIFEVPLRELVGIYLRSRNPEAPNALERDTDFAGSAAALVLLKSSLISPDPSDASDGEEETLSPEQLAVRLTEYLKVRRGAEALRARFASNAGHYASAHLLPPRPGRLRIDEERLLGETGGRAEGLGADRARAREEDGLDQVRSLRADRAHAPGSRVRGPRGSGWESLRLPSWASESAAAKATALFRRSMSLTSLS